MAATKVTRVLIVEDDDLVRQYTQTLVLSFGHELVAAVACPQDALGILSQDRAIDLLITDLLLPGDLDGFALAKRAHQDHPDLAVLLVSGQGATELQAGDPMEGRLSYLRKPFRKKQLAESIATLLDA